MAIFFTADPHFFHDNVIQYCHRPFVDAGHMNMQLIINWNQTVTPTDTVFILGDFAFNKPKYVSQIAEQLNGRKILIRGNHDHSAGKMQRFGNPIFDSVHHELLTDIEGIGTVRMSHYPFGPISFWDKLRMKSKGFDLRYLERRPKIDGNFLLHGHVHCAWKKNGKQINVGVDVWDYKPVSTCQIKLLMDDPRGFLK